MIAEEERMKRIDGHLFGDQIDQFDAKDKRKYAYTRLYAAMAFWVSQIKNCRNKNCYLSKFLIDTIGFANNLLLLCLEINSSA